MENTAFVNRYYREDWIQEEGYEYGSTGERPDGKHAVYDGATNYMGWIDPKTGEMSCTGEPTPYKLSFLHSAMEAFLEA